MSPTRPRPRWVGWVPAMILSAAIIATIITTTVLVAGGLGKPAPSPTPGQVTDKNWSIFTATGLAYIDKSREVRIDFAHQPVAAEPLGLEDDATLTIGPHASGADYYLIVNGGAPGQGGDKFTSSSMTISTANGVISSVRTRLSDVQNFRQTLDGLVRKGELFGWDTSGVDAIYDQVNEATKNGEPYEFGFGPASAIGVPVSVTAYCDTTGYCAVEYEVTPAVR